MVKQHRQHVTGITTYRHPVQCPYCVESGRPYVKPRTIATAGIERYHDCRHPKCGKRFKSYEEK